MKRNCIHNPYSEPHSGPYFFENVEASTETVKGKMSTHAQYIPTHSMANETMDVLQGMFGHNIISHRAALTWPQRSPNQNAPDYYL